MKASWVMVSVNLNDFKKIIMIVATVRPLLNFYPIFSFSESDDELAVILICIFANVSNLRIKGKLRHHVW